MMLVLASQSPRRRELLASLGVNFKVTSADIDESVRPNERADDYVQRLALEKAQAVLPRYEGHSGVWALGSDTTVVSGKTLLGKPDSLDEHKHMMRLLSGQTHRVLTSIALVSQDQLFYELVETKVTFAPITLKQVEAYWRTGEPRDKAGGYGIQGLGSVFVDRIEGSYSAVVGLPLRETARILGKAKITIWNGHLSLTD